MSYIYIEIPDGWQFVGKMKIWENEEIEKDVFIAENGNGVILLQDMVKECLRKKDRSLSVVSLPVVASDKISLHQLTRIQRP